MSELRFTGERVVPGDMGEYMDVLAEHLARYVFAIDFLQEGDRVLDAACGTGYGSFLLAMGAHSVLGLDVAQEAVDFASARFVWPGLRYEVADLGAVPLPSELDLIVSFETVEHLREPGSFVQKVAGALKADGLFICSIPRDQPSDFHRHVYDLDGARELLEPWFDETHWYGQRNMASAAGTLHGLTIDEADVADARYFIAVCRGPIREGATSKDPATEGLAQLGTQSP